MTITRWTRLACIALTLGGRALDAQTEYYDLDSGRPARVEDAVPTEWREIELQFLPLRVDRVGDGIQRYRLEPKVAYGVLPRTEVEVRAPLMEVRAPGSAEVLGLASVAVGALYAFNLETGSIPALALAGEMVIPAGSLSARTGSYSLKGLLTKTLPFARLQLNVAGGTWSVPPRSNTSSLGSGTVCGNAPAVPPCLIPDVPCDLVPIPFGVPRDAPRFSCAASTGVSATSATGVSATTGAHWTAGIGIDHTFPMISTLIVADLAVDRFVGLYALDDWTAELGVRHQLTPELIGDVGIARRFAGTTQSTSVIFGVSYAAPLRRLFH